MNYDAKMSLRKCGNPKNDVPMYTKMLTSFVKLKYMKYINLLFLRFLIKT